VTGPLTEAELATLYGKYAFLLKRRLRFLLRDEALAQDVLHDGFVKVMQTGSGVRDVETPLKWLYRVFDNVAIDRLRTQRARGQHTPLEDVPDDEIGPAPGHDAEARDAVLKVLGELDETDARIAILVFVDGLTQDEASQELGVSRVTVNKRIQALRARSAALLGGRHD
jgi:RNA polymerase sigma factor (sigma-70 family)